MLSNPNTPSPALNVKRIHCGIPNFEYRGIFEENWLNALYFPL